MKEKPILFSAPMVRAILDGTKTQTRRVIKRHLDDRGLRFVTGWEDWHGCPIKCPYGKPGDHLWVRETWCPGYFSDGKPGYRADWFNPRPEVVAETKWKPSIYMPRKFSRILLRVTDIRVERVQDINRGDVRAEGLENFYGPSAPYSDGRTRFMDAWDSINAKRGYSWESNPWVWAVSFERVKL